MAKQGERGRILRDLRQTRVFEDADVWLLQEAAATVPEIAREMDLDYVYAPTDEVQGLAILSRYAIEEPERIALPQYNLKFNTRCRIALAAEIQGVPIVNIHLDTRITQKQRLDQVSSLLHGKRMLIGGDFNTANVRWVGNLLPVPGQNNARAMRDMFVSRGFDSPLDNAGPTFKLLGLPLHLDWIFPKDLKTVASGVEEIGFSDHHAVWVNVRPESP